MPASFASSIGSFSRLAVVVLTLALAGCAALAPVDPPVVRIVGLQPLPSEGLELRFGVRMRVQNPGEHPIEYDGVSVSLDLDGRGLGSGVSQQRGTIERFGEALIEVPVTISLFSALRQALAGAGRLERGEMLDGLPYALTGKLGAASGGAAVRFESEGRLEFPAPAGPAGARPPAATR
jgi:LEA14-like dessication related protein